ERNDARFRAKCLENDLTVLKDSSIQDYRQLCQYRLHDLAKELGYNSDERVSLYVHRPKLNRFELLERHSPNPKWEHATRRYYPDNEGCIALAWENGEHFESLAEGTDWVSWCRSRGLTKKKARKIRMRSRLYFGWRVMDREREKK